MIYRRLVAKLITKMSEKKFNLDSALDQIGYGRFQTLSVWTLALIRTSGLFAPMIFAFLIYEQKFLCTTEGDSIQYECSAEEICTAKDAGSPLTYTVDESYEYYMNNWYVQMDLLCTPESSVSQILSWNLFGSFFSIVFSALPDSLGRKKSMHIGMIINLISQLVVIYATSIPARAIGFFVEGLTSFKSITAIVWSTENVPLANRPYALSAINVYSCLPSAIFGVYSLLISRDWYSLMLFNFATNVLAYLLVFALPESPRWLLYGGRT